MKPCSIATVLVMFWLCSAYSKIIQDQENIFDVHGNYIQTTEHSYDPNAANCCIVPTCNDIECYDAISCDHVCSEGTYKPISNYPTRGYKQKTYYEKYECHFGECKNFRFLCNHCPDPRLPDFSIHTLRKDCMNCYH